MAGRMWCVTRACGGNEQLRMIADGQTYNSSICEQRSTEDCFAQKFGRVTVLHG